MNAMILAAGFGTRMLPLTRVLPKALLPVAGQTLLEWNLRYLASQGAATVVVNAHHIAGQVQAALEDMTGSAEKSCPSGVRSQTLSSPSQDRNAVGDLTHVRLELSQEEEILGTGGGLARAAHLLTGDPVVVLNVDMLFRPDLRPILEMHSRLIHHATLVCVRDPRHAKIRISDHRVIRIHADAEPALKDLWAFSGLSILSGGAVEEIRSRFTLNGAAVFGDLRDLLLEWAERGRLGAWQETASAFMEAGSPEAYWELCREMAGFPGDTVEVQESVHLPGAVVEPGAQVRRCVLGPGSRAVGSVDRVAAAAGEWRTMSIPSADEEAAILRALKGSGVGVATIVDPATASFHPARCCRPSIRRLKGDGSGRTLFRAVCSGRSFVIAREPDPSMSVPTIYPTRHGPGAPGPIESYLYIHAVLRERGVRVPEVIGVLPEERVLVMEDLGDRHLFDLLAGQSDRTGPGRPGAGAAVRSESHESDPGIHNGVSRLRHLYELALDQLDAIHSPQGRSFDPGRTNNVPYEPGFVRQYEIGYFMREMVLTHLSLSGPDDAAGWEREIELVLHDAFSGVRPVLMHRDFQSRNLMAAGGELVVIDFQGARYGPPEYDLASLIYDPYADLPDQMKVEMETSYLIRTASRITTGADEAGGFRTRLRACGICRLMQALGAFAYLGGRLGKPGFLEHAPAAARSLADLAGYRFPAVASLARRVHAELQERRPDLARAGVSGATDSRANGALRDLVDSRLHPESPYGEQQR